MRTASASYTAWREMAPSSARTTLSMSSAVAVRPVGHRPQDRQALGRDLQTVPAEHRVGVEGRHVVQVGGHPRRVRRTMDSVQI